MRPTTCDPQAYAPPQVLISILICKPKTRTRLDIRPCRKFEIDDAHVRSDKYP